MESKNRYKKISCLGFSFIYPIIDLYQKLKSFQFTGKSKTQVSENEMGYSCSIILLVVAVIESFLNRIKYFSYSKFKKEKNNYLFFEKYFKNKDLAEKIIELYILRDSIIHNHLWCISYSFDEGWNEIKTYHRLIKIYGDPKFKIHVDRKERRTKFLKLNIVPIRIGIEDTKIVLKTLNEFLLFLESKRKLNISNFHLFINKKTSVTFPEFVDREGDKTKS